MLRNLFEKYPVGGCYALAILIVVAVLIIGMLWIVADPTVASMAPALGQFVETRGSYINLFEIVAFMTEVQPAAVLILFFAASPTIAAIVASVTRSDTKGLQSLLSRFRPWRKGVAWQQGVRVWLVFFVVYLGIGSGYLWLTDALAGPYAFDKAYGTVGAAPFAVVTTLLLGALIDEGGTLEELGWRGYILPLLIDKTRSPLKATLFLAVLWWAWHLPRYVPDLIGSLEMPAFILGQLVFLLLCIGLSIIITYVFNLTGGSVWAGILVHGGTNVWSKALEGPLHGALGFDLRDAVVFVIAVTILLLTRGKLGARSTLRPNFHRSKAE